MRKRITLVIVVIGAVLAMTAVTAVADFSFGLFRDQQLSHFSYPLFGVGTPLANSSTQQVSQSDAQADPTKLVTLASGLTAKVVTTQGPAVDDQISLWPNDRNPTYLIACNEQGTTDPGLVRIELATGIVSTIVTGTTSCDPTRRTPWGTIVFGEEAGSGPTGGRLYELIDPLHTTGVTLDRTTGMFSGGVGRRTSWSTRTALGTGRVRRPRRSSTTAPRTSTVDDSGFGPKNGGPGDVVLQVRPRQPVRRHITDHRPLAVAVRLGRGLRPAGRPEHELRPGPRVRVRASGSRCRTPTTRTSRAKDSPPGSPATTGPRTPTSTRSRCGRDSCASAAPTPATRPTTSTVRSSASPTARSPQAEANTATPELQPFVIGGTSQGINMPDNIAFQPRTGNVVLHEDAETTFESPHNNDLWDCLPDGADQDLLSDGCVRIATLNDLTAEWTGGIFDATGTHFFVSVQHNISGQATILDITGWK